MGEKQAQLISRFLPDGTLLSVNEAYCSFFTKKREELIGHSFMPLILKEDQGKMQQSISSLGKENPIAIHDYRFLADNGQISAGYSGPTTQHLTKRALSQSCWQLAKTLPSANRRKRN